MNASHLILFFNLWFAGSWCIIKWWGLINGQGMVYSINRKTMANYTHLVVRGGKEYFTLLYLNGGQGWKSSSEGKVTQVMKFWRKESLYQSRVDGASVNIEGKSTGRHITELFTRNQALYRKTGLEQYGCQKSWFLT